MIIKRWKINQRRFICSQIEIVIISYKFMANLLLIILLLLFNIIYLDKKILSRI